MRAAPPQHEDFHLFDESFSLLLWCFLLLFNHLNEQSRYTSVNRLNQSSKDVHIVCCPLSASSSLSSTECLSSSIFSLLSCIFIWISVSFYPAQFSSLDVLLSREQYSETCDPTQCSWDTHKSHLSCRTSPAVYRASYTSCQPGSIIGSMHCDCEAGLQGHQFGVSADVTENVSWFRIFLHWEAPGFLHILMSKVSNHLRQDSIDLQSSVKEPFTHGTLTLDRTFPVFCDTVPAEGISIWYGHWTHLERLEYRNCSSYSTPLAEDMIKEPREKKIFLKN